WLLRLPLQHDGAPADPTPYRLLGARGGKYQRDVRPRPRTLTAVWHEGRCASLLVVLVLHPELGLCFIDGHVHEVRLNLDEKLQEEVAELLEARDGSVCLQLALDYSGRGRVIGVR